MKYSRKDDFFNSTSLVRAAFILTAARQETPTTDTYKVWHGWIWADKFVAAIVKKREV
jgi:hypothetical protein